MCVIPSLSFLAFVLSRYLPPNLKEKMNRHQKGILLGAIFICGFCMGNLGFLIYNGRMDMPFKRVFYTRLLRNSAMSPDCLKDDDMMNNEPFIHLNVNDDEAIWPLIEKKAKKETKRLFVITPTVKQPTQIADLTRLAQALFPVRYFVTWFIYEDSAQTKMKYPEHLNFIRRHLTEFTRDENFDIRIRWTRLRVNGSERRLGNPRGVEARLDGIQAVRTEFPGQDGVIYFADDDNTYDSEIFSQMLQTEEISAWPVGFVTPRTQLTSPVVDFKTGQVVDIYDGWKANRRFPMDFAGFAVRKILLMDNPHAKIPYIAGYEETMFLGSIGAKLKELEPIAYNSTKVLTYHTKTTIEGRPERFRKYTKFITQQSLEELHDTNIADLYREYFNATSISLRRTYTGKKKLNSTVSSKPKQISKDSKVAENPKFKSATKNATKIGKSKQKPKTGITPGPKAKTKAQNNKSANGSTHKKKLSPLILETNLDEA